MSRKIMYIVEMKGEGEYNRHIRKDRGKYMILGGLFYRN